MEKNRIISYIRKVVENMPADWLRLTTHRLDIYNEELAKVQFLEHFAKLYQDGDTSPEALSSLPTAYDYIRLGHPLSCILEWCIAHAHAINPEHVISFSSRTMPILAVLRKNALEQKRTRILHTDSLPEHFDEEVIKSVYEYKFSVHRIESEEEITEYDGSTILLTRQEDITTFALNPLVDFHINAHAEYGSIIVISSEDSEAYVSEIQHVRRRETVAMIPAVCLQVLELMIGRPSTTKQEYDTEGDKKKVLESIKEITATEGEPLLASSGLSIQYAIMMGLVHHALEEHKGKAIKFVVPPNCYGGTNDQARRVAACIENGEIVDLPVDGNNDMVKSTHRVLEEIAHNDAVPFIIAEIPTNPRVEVPDLVQLKEALAKKRRTKAGALAIEPVFILDQTFCPNVHFLGEGKILSGISSISYSSGSKFASGGLCNAGYCVGNSKTESVMEKIALHLRLCENQATDLQMNILSRQLPSMLHRIQEAYANTREFVTFINTALPDAKINFVSEELAAEGFTPSVFSLDLPTKGDTKEEKEAHKRALNHKMIQLMITEIPDESKHCVSYGQLKGCYWTIPATSTQGTTKEGDKDYIARVALSPSMDMDLHKQVFSDFVESMK